MKLQYISTGWRYGATGFVANYLTACGFPCGHEVFSLNPEGGVVGDKSRCPLGLLPEEISMCSCHYAFQWWDKPSFDSVPVVLVLRHPLSVLRSSSYMISETLPNLVDEMLDVLDRIEHSGRIKDVFRVEDQLPELCKFLGVKPVSTEGIERNRHTPLDYTFTRWVNLPPLQRNSLQEVCRRFDYSI